MNHRVFYFFTTNDTEMFAMIDRPDCTVFFTLF